MGDKKHKVKEGKKKEVKLKIKSGFSTAIKTLSTPSKKTK